MNPLTKKFRYSNTKRCPKLMAESLLMLNGRDYYQMKRTLERKLEKAYLIGYATGINEYKRTVKDNRRKNRALKSVERKLRHSTHFKLQGLVFT